MRLSKVKSVYQLGRWFQQRGLSPGENAAFGGVAPVHSSTSMHYRYGVKSNLLSSKQGNLAIDLNDRDVNDTRLYRLVRGDWRLWRPVSETEALKHIHRRVVAMAKRKHWPLEECFHDGLGFIVELGHGHNHPISGHDGHLHVAFYRHSF